MRRGACRDESPWSLCLYKVRVHQVHKEVLEVLAPQAPPSSKTVVGVPRETSFMVCRLRSASGLSHVYLSAMPSAIQRKARSSLNPLNALKLRASLSCGGPRPHVQQ